MADGILASCNVARSRHCFRQVTAPCNVAHGIVTVNSPSGSTLQCDMWLWDDMPLNSPKRPPYWNFTWFRFRPHHRSRHAILHQSPKFYAPSAEKMTSCRYSRWRISAILDFRGPIIGSLKNPCTTSYRSLGDTIALNCLVFEIIAYFCIFGDRQSADRLTNKRTDGQHRCTKPLSLLGSAA